MKFGEKTEARFIALLCFVFTPALHGDAVSALLSLVEKESTLRCSVFFLRFKSGEPPQCSDVLVLWQLCCEHIHKVLCCSDCFKKTYH